MEEDKQGCVTTEDVYELLYKHLSRQTLTYKGKKHEKAFYYKDAIEYLIKAKISSTEESAKDYIDGLMESHYLYFINGNSNPSDEELLCRFKKDNPDRGHQPDKTKTWSLVLKQAEKNSYISLKGVTDFHEKCPFISSMYLDQHNCKLYDVVRPVEWIDPVPTEPYDLVVIGAGAGGIAAAVKAIQKNFKVALIERCYMGGTYYNSGKIAFDALEQCAEMIQKVLEAKVLGLDASKEIPNINMKKIMEQARLKRAQISPQFCNIFSLTDTYGIDVYLGSAKFVSSQHIMVNDRTIEFSKVIIATGAQPSIPKIEGLSNVPYYTIESIFNMTKRPNALVIYGSGKIACAFAQVFQRMQIEVTILSEDKKLVDSCVSDSLNKYTEHILKGLGVKVLTNVSVTNIENKKGTEPKAAGQLQDYIINADIKGVKHAIVCQAILIATPKTVIFSRAILYISHA